MSEETGRFSNDRFTGKPPLVAAEYKKKKPDKAKQLARIRELRKDLYMRRTKMSPQGPKREINPFNDPL